MTVKWSGQVLKVIILKLGSFDNRLKTSTFCRDTVSQKKLKMGGRVRRKDKDNNREEDRGRKRERERVNVLERDREKHLKPREE